MNSKCCGGVVSVANSVRVRNYTCIVNINATKHSDIALGGEVTPVSVAIITIFTK